MVEVLLHPLVDRDVVRDGGLEERVVLELGVGLDVGDPLADQVTVPELEVARRHVEVEIVERADLVP